MDRSQKGSSLLEIILAITLFMLIAPAIVNLSLGGHTSLTRSLNRTQAAALGQEALEAVRAIKNHRWDNVTPGVHGLTDANGYYELTPVPDVHGKHTRTITVTEINSYTKEIVVRISWEPFPGIPNTFTATDRLTDWKTTRWIQTLASDFEQGAHYGTHVKNVTGGEVELRAQGTWGNVKQAATLDIPGDAEIQEIFLRNGILYAVTRDEPAGPEFFAYDTNDVENGNLTTLGSTELSADAYSVVTNNEYAFIGTDDSAREVTVIRLSDYSIVNGINIPHGSAHSLFLSGTKLYVGSSESNNANFFSFDVSDPLSAIPQIQSVATNDDIEDIVISGNYAFLATHLDTGEMTVVRLSDFTAVQRLDLPGNANGRSIYVDERKQRAYIGRDESGSSAEFYVLDIRSPETATVLSSIEIGDDARDIFVSGHLAYAATDGGWKKEVVVINLNTNSLLTTIDLLGSNTTPSIILSGDYLFAASRNAANNIQVLQAGDEGWAFSGTLATYDVPGTADGRDITIADQHVYVAMKNNPAGAELYIYHLVTPTSLSLVGTYEAGNNINAVAVSGNFAYLATSSDTQEIIVLDITSKVNPIRVGSYDTNGAHSATSLFLVDSTLFVGTRNNGGPRGGEFYSFNVQNPAEIQLLGLYEVNADVEKISVDNNMAYIAARASARELEIVDVSNPTNLTRIASYDIPGTHQSYGLAYNAGLIYFVTDDSYNNNDFFIIDVVNPAAPFVKGALNLGRNNYAVTIDAQRKLVFLATNQSIEQLTVLDISDNTNPKLYAVYNTDDTGQALFYNASNIYLLTRGGDGELAVIGPSETGSYVTEGIFTSSILDTGSSNTSYRTLDWIMNGAENGSLGIQIRTASSSAGLEGAAWTGPGGAGTDYTVSGSTIVLNQENTGTRYFQYRVLFNGDGEESPILQNISIVYTP